MMMARIFLLSLKLAPSEEGKIGFSIRRDDYVKHKGTPGSHGMHTKERKARFEQIFRGCEDPRIYSHDIRFEKKQNSNPTVSDDKAQAEDEPNAKKQKISPEETDELFDDFSGGKEDEDQEGRPFRQR